jgi:muramidase (phage lysozyme)
MNANVPTGAATPAASDKYHVYRPMLDLIGLTEGTDRKRGYNETLAYGAYTGGDVNLVGMTLQEIDALQTKMLKHPKNSFNSSALGRYQIVRTTLRTIRKTLKLPATAPFDADMQDRCACYLLGLRGIDKYLAARLSENTLIDNLAQEWASLPTVSGKGVYAGQSAAVKPDRVRQALADVKRRHQEAQPLREIVVEKEIDKPVVPISVEAEIRKHTDQWSWITTILGSGGAGLAALGGMDWQTVTAIGALALGGLIIALLLRRQIICAVQEVRRIIETG